MTKRDPRYVNIGEEWDEEDFSWRYIDNFDNLELLETVFRICGNRKYFKSPKESRRWKKIDGQLSRGVIRSEWVWSCVKWAEAKNSVRFVIKVDALASAVLNKAAMQDWLKENADDLIRPEDFW